MSGTTGADDFGAFSGSSQGENPMPLSLVPGRLPHMHRQIAGKLTGPVTKWIVLVAVLLIAGGLSSLAGKLIDVQNNETESWLPESAESTKAFEKLNQFQD